jgi:hypothetical protein
MRGTGTSRLKWALAAALIISGIAAAPAVTAPFPPDISGEWMDVKLTGSFGWDLKVSPDRQTLTANWHGGPGGPHATLVGDFTGTLNSAGNAYVGPMHVSEAGAPAVSGTMTFTMGPEQYLGYPILTVTYSQENGVTGTIKFEIWFLPPQPVKGPTPGATIDETCPGTSPCNGTVDVGVPTGSAMSYHPGDVTAKRAVKKGKLGSVHFKIPPGQRKTITVSLNKRGRKLLAKRGTLTVAVTATLKGSHPGLPKFQNAGAVTLTK